jgi:acetyl esterase
MTTASPAQPLGQRYPALDPVLAEFLDARAAQLADPAEPSDVTVEALRLRVRAGDQLCAPGPEMLDVDDVLLAGGVTVRRYVPHRLRTGAVLVWLHGGGWVTGDLNYSDGFCRSLADGLGCEVRSVDYRLAPEHPFPAAVTDVLDAIAWTTDSGRRIVLAGDSAGANLAAVAAQELRERRDVTVVGQVLIYPVLDHDVGRESYHRNVGLVLGADEMGWFFDQYLPDRGHRDSPRFAPLRATALRGLPPTVIAVAGHDPLRDEGVAYAEALQRAGVPVTLLEYPSLVHGFLRFTGPVPAAADAAARLVVATAALLAPPA